MPTLHPDNDNIRYLTHQVSRAMCRLDADPDCRELYQIAAMAKGDLAHALAQARKERRREW